MDILRRQPWSRPSLHTVDIERASGRIAPYQWCQRVDMMAASYAQRVKHKGNNLLTLSQSAACHLSHGEFPPEFKALTSLHAAAKLKQHLWSQRQPQ